MTDTIVAILILLISVPLCLWMVYASIRYGIVGAFNRLKVTLEAIYMRLAHGPAEISLSTHQVKYEDKAETLAWEISKLETAVAVPLEEVIRQAEARAIREQAR